MEHLDKTDKAILLLLQQNSNLRVKEIADIVGLSATPTYERIRKMEKEGYIKKYVAILDRDKIQQSLLVYCNVTLKEQSQSSLDRFEQAVVALPEVMEVTCMSGGFDYMLKIVAYDMKSYHLFVVNKLSAIDNIANVQSSFVMSEIKNETAYPL